MQLPKDFHGVDCHSRNFIFILVLRFLQSEIQQGHEKKGGWNLHGMWTSVDFYTANNLFVDYIAAGADFERKEEQQTKWHSGNERKSEQFVRFDGVFEKSQTVLFERYQQRFCVKR